MTEETLAPVPVQVQGPPAHPLGSLAPLAAWHQWIVVMLVPLANGKTTKLPVDHRTGNVCDAHKPEVWTEYGTAATLAERWGASFTVGFVLTAADPFFCVDLDSVLTPAGWSPAALQILGELPGTAVEVSQSGQGLHAWGQGVVPPHSMKREVHGIKAEFYTELRFVTLGTGAVGDMSQPCPTIAAFAARHFPVSASGAVTVAEEGPCAEWRGPTDDAELIRRAMRSQSAAGAFKGKASFADLWTGDAQALGRTYPADASSTEPYDRSSADAALASMLAFWTGRDVSRIERLMRQSALARAKWDDRADYLVERTIRGACARQVEVLQDRAAPAGASASPTVGAAASDAARAQLTFIAAAQGAIDATIENVTRALQSAESGIRIAYDDFRGRIVISSAATPWQPLRDVDYARLRVAFGSRGFKPVSAEIMKSAVDVVAEACRIDSAKDWAAGLTWGGQPRIGMFLHTHCGAPDTPYTRAVSTYLWTALAGRLLEPGCQADMVPVFVSPQQGLRKSSAIAALVPDSELFAEIHFQRIDCKDTSRLMKGKLVAEIAELQGLRGRERESIKAFITRRIERFIDHYEKFETAYPRRLVFIGTTNESKFLHDPTGERRWLPFNVGRVDVEAIARDRDQLWAEGIARFTDHGVAYREAERLAKLEHAEFKDDDEWQPLIERWLDTPAPPGFAGAAPSSTPRGAEPFLLAELALGALGLAHDRLEKKQQWRIGEILRSLGYAKDQKWINGRNVKAWRRAPSPFLSNH